MFVGHDLASCRGPPWGIHCVARALHLCYCEIDQQSARVPRTDVWCKKLSTQHRSTQIKRDSLGQCTHEAMPNSPLTSSSGALLIPTSTTKQCSALAQPEAKSACAIIPVLSRTGTLLHSATGFSLLVEDLGGTLEATGAAGSNETNLLAGGRVPPHSGGMTDMLVVTTTVGMFYRVHGHTTHLTHTVTTDETLDMQPILGIHYHLPQTKAQRVHPRLLEQEDNVNTFVEVQIYIAAGHHAKN